MSARRGLGDVRELVLLLAGVALLAFGILSRPRDPATIATGIGLLVGPPAVAAATSGPPSRSSDDLGGSA